NLDVWEEAGMTPPERYSSWDDVWEDAKKLTQRDDAGNITLAGLSFRNYQSIQYLCGGILEQGAQYVDEQTGKWDLNTDEAKRTLKEWFWDPFFTHEVDSPDLPEIHDSLAEGRMALGGIWIDYIPYAKSAFPEGRFGFTMRPGMDGVDPIVVGEGGWGLSINAATQYPAEASEFIAYLNRDDVMLQWLQEQHSLPCVHSLMDNPWFETEEAKFLLPALKTVDGWKWIGPVGNKYAMDDIFLPGLEELSLGDISVDELADRLSAELTAKVQSFMDENGYQPGLAGL
ncbi:MAG: extracellular solute-binding protein, partial [Anaerolineales bacterium]|nr:extracellular solute-binding protein [Anaerolineales bacterium]